MPDRPVIAKDLSSSVGRFKLVDLANLRPSPNNARKHTKAQIRDLAKSIEAFGFLAPILADREGNILAGHARYEAAKLRGMACVPVIFVDHLTEAQAQAYMLADNKLTDRSSWDEPKLAIQLKGLMDLALDFDIGATGFEAPEIDFRIQSLEENLEEGDAFELPAGPAVSIVGDVWHLDYHRIFCGDALDPGSFTALMGEFKATAAFTDPPYNVKIDGHVGGKGKVQPREFAMASGEMTPPEFTTFLISVMTNLSRSTAPGALLYTCMDWRHMPEILAAGTSTGLDLLNLCVWVKSNGGMGSLYRSRHELIFVFKNGSDPHLNNVQLGRFGRNRTNVWNYTGANAFSRPLPPTASIKPRGTILTHFANSTTVQNISRKSRSFSAR